MAVIDLDPPLQAFRQAFARTAPAGLVYALPQQRLEALREQGAA